MNLLVIGQGGREHALVKALRESRTIDNLFCSPGSDGIAADAKCTAVVNESREALLHFIKTNNIDLVVVGPEQPLVDGLADFLRTNHIAVFGPNQEGAHLEGSKVFSKEFMIAAEIPTAPSVVVRTFEEALMASRKWQGRCVLKVDGLAAGKGVFVCSDMAECERAANEVFRDSKFGLAGKQALIEERLEGWELSYLILTNGIDYEPLCLAQDHKRLQDHDKGPNTGGMGAVAPMKIEPLLESTIHTQILSRVMSEMKRRKFDYRGILYVGLMITAGGPKVIEFNVRFGDPEAQVILPLMKGDWGQTFLRVSQGEVPRLEWKSGFAATVVLASEGYPDEPKKGVPILVRGAEAGTQATGAVPGGGDSKSFLQESYLLHAGTKRVDGVWQTNGGRVFCAVGLGQNQEEALRGAYAEVERVSWPGMQLRKDIGKTWRA